MDLTGDVSIGPLFAGLLDESVLVALELELGIVLELLELGIVLELEVPIVDAISMRSTFAAQHSVALRTLPAHHLPSVGH